MPSFDKIPAFGRAAVAYPIRWHDMLRHPDHTLLLWATGSDQLAEMMALA